MHVRGLHRLVVDMRTLLALLGVLVWRPILSGQAPIDLADHRIVISHSLMRNTN